jgi:hypothetical protein
VFDAEGHVVAGLPVQVALRMLFDKLLKGDARRAEVTYSDVVAFAQVRVSLGYNVVLLLCSVNKLHCMHKVILTVL